MTDAVLMVVVIGVIGIALAVDIVAVTGWIRGRLERK
jgi:hypothetical protein